MRPLVWFCFSSEQRLLGARNLGHKGAHKAFTCEFQDVTFAEPGNRRQHLPWLPWWQTDHSPASQISRGKETLSQCCFIAGRWFSPYNDHIINGCHLPIIFLKKPRKNYIENPGFRRNSGLQPPPKSSVCVRGQVEYTRDTESQTLPMGPRARHLTHLQLAFPVCNVEMKILPSELASGSNAREMFCTKFITVTAVMPGVANTQRGFFCTAVPLEPSDSLSTWSTKVSSDWESPPGSPSASLVSPLSLCLCHSLDLYVIICLFLRLFFPLHLVS